MKNLKFALTGLTIVLAAVFFAPDLAWCADLHIPGKELSAVWVIPFACMLLSIAICPLAVPHFWEHHFGKVAIFWGLAFLVPCAIAYGPGTALYEFWHAMLSDYVPFIILLFTLFTVAGGVRLTGSLIGTPKVNIAILLVGTFLASWMGTTGAAMLFIRPLLRANAHRKYKVHSVVFFIFMVANAGGSLTPLGDPPLFLGFLRGVPFFWTAAALLVKTGLLIGLLTVIYLLIETYLYNKEGRPVPPAESHNGEKFGLEGKVNLLLLLGVVAMVLFSGAGWSGRTFEVYHVTLALENIARDASLLFIAFLSWKLTNRESRTLNGFNWEPIKEVGKLFFGIFLSMIPAIAILQAGTEGALGSVIRLVTDANGQPVNAMYFWLAGALSSFLDNAPTYVVFFNTAGGDVSLLTNELATTLAAISAGAVFMGANTYIGNAPNFMVRSIAENQGVKMPSFFGYMAWSVGILIPCFILLTVLFFL
ncbi:MAG: sodium:proton antiporter [Deltaproteobacteria bacterium]|jgi:Na+/H+ antiporter NhaD/arsenite permease-like protein|nr:sodium:proton antiporter [Deltaproteobacteria bacterium]